MNELMKIADAAEYLHVPVATLRWYRQSGLGPKSAKICGRVMYRRSDLDNYVREQFNGAA